MRLLRRDDEFGGSGGDMAYICEVIWERSLERRLTLAMETRGEVKERRKGLLVDLGEASWEARVSTSSMEHVSHPFCTLTMA